MLERILYGSKKDRLKQNVSDDQPGLFDDYFKEAVAEKEAAVKETVEAIEKEARKRRESARKAPSRPQRYRYCGLEERVRILNPDGLDLDQCEMIGKDTVRTVRWEPSKIWVDVLEMPIYRLKSDKNQPNPQLYQAKAPQAVIGGNHVGAELQTGYTEINCPMQFFSKGIYIIGVEINGADYFTQKVLKTD